MHNSSDDIVWIVKMHNSSDDIVWIAKMLNSSADMVWIVKMLNSSADMVWIVKMHNSTADMVWIVKPLPPFVKREATWKVLNFLLRFLLLVVSLFSHMFLLEFSISCFPSSFCNIYIILIIVFIIVGKNGDNTIGEDHEIIKSLLLSSSTLKVSIILIPNLYSNCGNYILDFFAYPLERNCKGGESPIVPLSLSSELAIFKDVRIIILRILNFRLIFFYFK